MSACIVFTCLQHLLQGTPRGSKKEIVVTVPKDSHEEIIDPAARVLFSKNDKEVINIEAVENGTKDPALLDTICEAEKV